MGQVCNFFRFSAIQYSHVLFPTTYSGMKLISSLLYSLSFNFSGGFSSENSPKDKSHLVEWSGLLKFLLLLLFVLTISDYCKFRVPACTNRPNQSVFGD